MTYLAKGYPPVDKNLTTEQAHAWHLLQRNAIPNTSPPGSHLWQRVSSDLSKCSIKCVFFLSLSRYT